MRTPSLAALAALAVAAATPLFACSAKPGIRSFYSDGCSLFPDGNLGDHKLWCDCCFAHDIEYWRGGTEEDRKHSDERLRECVLGKTGDARLAGLMYDGVRLGGSPVFVNWYRWGYGWPYGRGYAPLTEAERADADARWLEYAEKNPAGYCGRR
jgi:hypothetical protein